MRPYKQILVKVGGFQRGGGQSLGKRGRRPPTVVGIRKLVFLLCSCVWEQYQRVTDRQTELPWLIQRSASAGNPQTLFPCNQWKYRRKFSMQSLFHLLSVICSIIHCRNCRQYPIYHRKSNNSYICKSEAH